MALTTALTWDCQQMSRVTGAGGIPGTAEEAQGRVAHAQQPAVPAPAR